MTVKSIWRRYYILLQLALVLAACALAVRAEKLPLYIHPVCKFAFDYPAGGKAVLGADELTQGTKDDSVTIRWKMGALGVRLLKMPLEKAIKETGALEKGNDGKWNRPGKLGTHGVSRAVQPFGKLTGVYCTSDCGVTGAVGFHAAGTSCLSGFLTDGEKTAYFETDGIFPTEEVVKVVLPSFRF